MSTWWLPDDNMQGNQPSFSCPVNYSAYSTHYAQAYLQAAVSLQADSSNHHPNSYRHSLDQPSPTHHTERWHSNSLSATNHSSSWYQLGNSRCTYKNCQYTGSGKAVEIHRMDRHLIYPPGWRKKPDWDADPSLKGKLIPIQGTNIFLDTPEALEAWITERKRRWPTSSLIADKKRKLAEAIASGQLVEDLMGKKRKLGEHTNNTGTSFRTNNFGRGRGRASFSNRTKGRQIGSSSIAQPPQVCKPGQTHPPKTMNTPAASDTSDSSTSDDDDDDANGPEVVSTKLIKIDFGEDDTSGQKGESRPDEKDTCQPTITMPIRKRPQPKKQPYNLFPSRPSLLRNLLLPEIRVTVSNLSQAIRFLVDNDFLQGVELKPGSEQRIQVLPQTEMQGGTAATYDQSPIINIQ